MPRRIVAKFSLRIETVKIDFHCKRLTVTKLLRDYSHQRQNCVNHCHRHHCHHHTIQMLVTNFQWDSRPTAFPKKTSFALFLDEETIFRLAN